MFSFRHIESIVKSYADFLPLDVFVLIGSFLEEIIPPIPAPLIMTTSGSLALAQNHTWLFLIWLAVIGSIGKTFASWVFYVLGDKFEAVAVKKFGKFIGINHQDVENLGKRFNGGWMDDAVLFALRSIPIFPSVSVSVVCGIIRLDAKTFIGATFFGTIIKNLIYLFAGYGGMRAIGFFVRKIHSTHFILGTIFVIISMISIYYLVRRNGKKKI